MEFKDRIKELRIGKKLTATNLAAVFNKSEGAVRMWETGRATPDLETLLKLSDFFECSTDYLLGKSDYKSVKIIDDINTENKSIIDEKNQLPPNILIKYNEIERFILGCYFNLEYECIDMAEEAINTVYTILEIFYNHCDAASAVLDFGPDSFTIEEIPNLRIEIKETTQTEISTLQEIIFKFFNKSKDRMLNELPEYEEEEINIIKELRSKMFNRRQENKEEDKNT